MRRKRRNRGFWLPILGTRSGEGGEGDDLTFQFALDAPANNNSPDLGIVPITFDFPQEGPTLSPDADTLAEIAGSEYILKRILGNCVVANRCYYDAATDDGASAIKVDAGFFVARAGAESQGPLGANGPIGYGADTTQSDREQYSPGNPATAREPWMWRRTWILGNEKKAFIYENSNGGAPVAYGYCPPTNLTSDVRNGPYIDVKSRRRVRQDERLFFAIQARHWPLADATAGDNDIVDVSLTVRLFGTLVKARNSGTF